MRFYSVIIGGDSSPYIVEAKNIGDVMKNLSKVVKIDYITSAKIHLTNEIIDASGKVLQEDE